MLFSPNGKEYNILGNAYSLPQIRSPKIFTREVSLNIGLGCSGLLETNTSLFGILVSDKEKSLRSLTIIIKLYPLSLNQNNNKVVPFHISLICVNLHQMRSLPPSLMKALKISAKAIKAYLETNTLAFFSLSVTKKKY